MRAYVKEQRSAHEVSLALSPEAAATNETDSIYSQREISPFAVLDVAPLSSMGVPSLCSCWSHNSGVSTPVSLFLSKNDLGLSL
jgi:hypothetical protein